ncbi:hypothetical protein LINPERPRIM_LOCUS19018 [Linum perenne]
MEKACRRTDVAAQWRCRETGKACRRSDVAEVLPKELAEDEDCLEVLICGEEDMRGGGGCGMLRSGRPRLLVNDRAEWYVEGDFYQFLWPKPGKGIGDGLLCIECEDDVLAFINARQNVGNNGISMGAPFTQDTDMAKSDSAQDGVVLSTIEVNNTTKLSETKVVPQKEGNDKVPTHEVGLFEFTDNDTLPQSPDLGDIPDDGSQ